MPEIAADFTGIKAAWIAMRGRPPAAHALLSEPSPAPPAPAPEAAPWGAETAGAHQNRSPRRFVGRMERSSSRLPSLEELRAAMPAGWHPRSIQCRAENGHFPWMIQIVHAGTRVTIETRGETWEAALEIARQEALAVCAPRAP